MIWTSIAKRRRIRLRQESDGDRGAKEKKERKNARLEIKRGLGIFVFSRTPQFLETNVNSARLGRCDGLK